MSKSEVLENLRICPTTCATDFSALSGSQFPNFFSMLVLAICFGTGFFLVLKQNSRLWDAEWLYRYERAGWLTTEENRQTLIDRER